MKDFLKCDTFPHVVENTVTSSFGWNVSSLVRVLNLARSSSGVLSAGSRKMEWSSAIKRQMEFGSDSIWGASRDMPFRCNSMQPVGQALRHLLSREFDFPVVVMGRDTRSAGKELSSDLIRGCLKDPLDVIDLGVITIPGVAYFTNRQYFGLVIVVSASPNPATYVRWGW